MVLPTDLLTQFQHKCAQVSVGTKAQRMLSYQNLRFMELAEPEQVCIFGSDHIYKMDSKQMLDFHKEKEASLTVSALRMPLSEASEFGVIEVGCRRTYDWF